MTSLTTEPTDASQPTTADDDNAKLDREEEKLLVHRATMRDTSAFAELYDKHVVRVYRHVYYLVSDASVAEDLTAQTFLKAWEAIDRYKERGAPFAAWLLRIAHNLTVSHLRSKRDHSELDEAFVDQKLHRNPEDALDRTQEEMSVRAAVMRLRDEQRQVIMLRFVEELDYKEVAAVIGKSIPAVRVIQHRALTNLRKLMADLTSERPVAADSIRSRSS
jgi:RNA polymerase sigma-70 factor (ECF subfamily)